MDLKIYPKSQLPKKYLSYFKNLLRPLYGDDFFAFIEEKLLQYVYEDYIALRNGEAGDMQTSWKDWQYAVGLQYDLDILREYKRDFEWKGE